MGTFHKLAALVLVMFTSSAFAVPPATEQQITFAGADGSPIAGTLTLPTSGAPVPAVLLIAGSGPTDRDGNQPPTLITDILKQFAQNLAAHNIASLRFDKRGMYANKSQRPKDPEKFSDFFSWENFLGDAANGYLFLQKQPHIDPTRVGILGHSEGGIIALQIAASLNSESHPPAFLILVSTPGRPMADVVRDQLKRMMAKQKATSEQVVYFTDQYNRINKTILDTGAVPKDVPPGLIALYPAYLGKFLHSELAVNPSKVVPTYPGPVLILAGGSDIQVSPDLDAKALDLALSSRKPDAHTLAIIPNASHNLKIINPKNEDGITGPVAQPALDQLDQWLADQLQQSPNK